MNDFKEIKGFFNLLNFVNSLHIVCSAQASEVQKVPYKIEKKFGLSIIIPTFVLVRFSESRRDGRGVKRKFGENPKQYLLL